MPLQAVIILRTQMYGHVEMLVCIYDRAKTASNALIIYEGFSSRDECLVCEYPWLWSLRLVCSWSMGCHSRHQHTHYIIYSMYIYTHMYMNVICAHIYVLYYILYTYLHVLDENYSEIYKWLSTETWLPGYEIWTTKHQVWPLHRFLEL